MADPEKLTAQERLKKWRGSRALHEAATLLGIHLSYVRMLENGLRKPGRVVALRLSKVARIPVSAWSDDKPAEVEQGAQPG